MKRYHNDFPTVPKRVLCSSVTRGGHARAPTDFSQALGKNKSKKFLLRFLFFSAGYTALEKPFVNDIYRID
jgi:hypothetical protein